MRTKKSDAVHARDGAALSVRAGRRGSPSKIPPARPRPRRACCEQHSGGVVCWWWWCVRAAGLSRPRVSVHQAASRAGGRTASSSERPLGPSTTPCGASPASAEGGVDRFTACTSRTGEPSELSSTRFMSKRLAQCPSLEGGAPLHWCHSGWQTALVPARRPALARLRCAAGPGGQGAWGARASCFTRMCDARYPAWPWASMVEGAFHLFTQARASVAFNFQESSQSRPTQRPLFKCLPPCPCRATHACSTA